MAESLLGRWLKGLSFKEIVIHDGFEIVVEFTTPASSTFFVNIEAIVFEGKTFVVTYDEELRTGNRCTVTFLANATHWPEEDLARHESLKPDHLTLTFKWGAEIIVSNILRQE